ncbi:serine/threonine protein kinase [Streptomyces sp. A3M-1-3]|uniref:serine/threonine-protein kinase n=1 Tax=Streptomyces sp. A3M-1-3 TaxID=2962044 RepID=UPI0020B7D884|nr:serine/threonine-protein kinase [Streptomyces sp. A3M-1-3]MCP3817930.1 serine/threonine protein kinase [Streptomyces sp. A3M-1-3]
MERTGPGDPQRIGAYRLLARLGAGGMGQVYLARSERGRTVAVKLVREELAAQEEFRSRFRQEVQAARRVGGQWTAPVLDADTEAPVPWLATGYVAGPSLQTVISTDHGPLPERSVRILAAGLAYALQDIHAAGLIHRDLKPSNVLVTIDGPRVIDFGIARALETVTDGGLTRTGALVGSPGFMAPEQVRGTPVTPACDVFCLGSVLAYAATGALPFGAADSGVHALMYRIAEEEPDLAALPDSLRDLVRDCLRKDPAARPAPADILARVGANDTVSDGRALEPWLPAALVAQLGRHAVQLLEAEDSGPEPPSPAPRATRPVHAMPTVIGPPIPPPAHAPAPPPPVYGYGPTPAYGPPPAPEPPRRNGRATAALVAVALVVALGAGGGVYAVMSEDHGNGGRKEPTASGTGTSTTDPKQSTTSESPSPTPSGENGVPVAYVGTWRATFQTDDGTHTRVLRIGQGGTGDTVMDLTGSGPTYDCRWTATLRASGPPLELGPSEVTFGDPVKCAPGQWSRLEMPDERTLVRELVGSTGTPVTYTKVG